MCLKVDSIVVSTFKNFLVSVSLTKLCSFWHTYFFLWNRVSLGKSWLFWHILHTKAVLRPTEIHLSLPPRATSEDVLHYFRLSSLLNVTSLGLKWSKLSQTCLIHRAMTLLNMTCSPIISLYVIRILSCGVQHKTKVQACFVLQGASPRIRRICHDHMYSWTFHFSIRLEVINRKILISS